ncbi:hypothetical protein L6R50_04505, partial [Myxococcota bacterium]|nr:hypothetical protein [Myxococcota bacterium]
MPRPAAAPLAALALVASVALPPAAHARVRCLTPERLAARTERAALADPNPYRPTSVGWVDSEAYPLRVHYRRESDAERASGVVLPAAEHSWAVEVDEMGWPAPPPDSGLGGDDRFDIYLTNEETYGGAYTWGTGGDVWTDDGWYTLSSYIAIDENPAWIPDDWMGDFVAHEFNHALQYTLDGWEKNLFVWEMTATAIEDFVYDDTNLYTTDFVDYQEMPFLSLIFDGYRPEVTAYDDWSYYEYGGAIFGIFLEQRYGADDGALLLALWEGLAFGDRADEPDVLDSLALLAPSEAADVAAIYLDFAEWRLFAADWDDGAHFDEGALWEEDAKAGIA